MKNLRFTIDDKDHVRWKKINAKNKEITHFLLWKTGLSALERQMAKPAKIEEKQCSAVERVVEHIDEKDNLTQNQGA